jgi:hypothetical protein
VGNALVVESDVSGTEQKAEEQDKEMSTTEPETDATVSDVGAKTEGDNAHGGETSDVDVEEVVNKEIEQEVVIEKLLVTEEDVLSVDVNKKCVSEIVHEELLAGVSSFAASDIGNKLGDNANATSFTVRKGSVLVGTRKDDVSGAVVWICDKDEKAVPVIDVKSNYRKGINKEQFSFEEKLPELNNTGTGNVQVSERHVILRDNVVQEITETDVRSKKTIQVQEIVQGKKSPVDIGSKVANLENVIEVHHQEDVTEVDISIIGRAETENKTNEDNDECEKAAISSCAAICENVKQIDVSLIDGTHVREMSTGRTEFFIDDETDKGRKQNFSCETAECSLKSEVPCSEIKNWRYENENVTVVKAMDISDMKTDYNNDANAQNSRTDGKIQKANFLSEAIEYNAPLSDNDSVSLHVTQQAQQDTQKHAEEFDLSDKDAKNRRCSTDTVTVGELTSAGNREITDAVNIYGSVSDVLMKTADFSHGTGENSCNAEICGHEPDEHASEYTVSEVSNYVRKHEECTAVSELYSTKATAGQDGVDLAGPSASGSVKTTGSNLQPKLYNNVTGDTEVRCSGTSNSAPTDESVVRISDVWAEVRKCSIEPQQKEACLISGNSPLECRAVTSEAGGEEMWEEVEELPSTDTVCEDDRLSESAVPDGDGGRHFMTDTPAFLQNAKLSQEEKELLDPRPLVDAEDEETLRRFIHSLNLADYSKEAVRSRGVIQRDGNTIEEVYATRRGKRRAPLETYCSQQRGLDVILEENSSDYSDGEKRVEEAGVLEERPRDKGWEEAIFIPETNQVVFLSNESDEGEYENLDVMGSAESGIRNRSVYYSEAKVMTDGMGNGECVRRVYQRIRNESRRVTTRIISEDVGVDVFSEVMEEALENVGETQDYDSEDDREGTDKMACGGDTGVTVELAESSDDEDAKGGWKRGRAREMQDTVEIVYLDEDSGSTSSSSCKATKKTEEEAADDADGEEEDPDVLYEEVEFPVVGVGNTIDITGEDEEGFSKTNAVSAVYENMEFHRNTKAVLTTKETESVKGNSDIPVNFQESPQCENEFSADVYEDVEFVRKEMSNITGRQPNLSTSVGCNENNLMHLPHNSNIIPGSDSEQIDSTHASRGNDEPNEVTEQFKITEGDDPVDSGREKVATVSMEDEVKYTRQSVSEVESSLKLESRFQADDDTNINQVVSEVRSHESNSIVESDDQSVEQYTGGTDVSKTVNVDNSQINANSKTMDIVKQILSLLPQRESIDNRHLKTIISQLTSESSETESLKEYVAERSEVDVIEKGTGRQRESDKKSPQIPAQIETDTELSSNSIYSHESEHNSNSKTVKSDVDSKSPRVSPEPSTDRGSEAIHRYGKCAHETNDESLQTPCQVDSHIRILNESTHFGQSGNNINTKAVQCNPVSKSPSTTEEQNTSSEIGTNIEQERPTNVSGEYGNLRDDEDGVDDLYSITPTNRSRPGSSSSDAGSHGTAVYCPGRFSPQSSDADVSSYAEDTIAENKPVRNKIYSPLNIRNRLSKSHSQENVSESKKNISPTFRNGTEINNKMSVSPKTLKDLSIDRVVSLPRGISILNLLGIHVPLRIPGINHDDNKHVNTLMQDNARPVSLAYRCKDKHPLSCSLPDISSVQHETILRDQSPGAVLVKSPPPPPVLSFPSLARNHWLGMPTKEDPNLLVCLSPSQRQNYQQGAVPTPEEAGNLLDLHCKFIQRRGYHENPPPPPSRRVFGTGNFSNETPFPNHYPSDKCLNREIDCRKPTSSSGGYVESEETSTAFELIPSPKFRTVLASLDSKIHSKGNAREVIGGLVASQVEEKRELGVRINEDKEEDGGGEKERGYDTSRSRGSSRLLAILRASSEPQEMQARHLSPSSSCSPPPLPPPPHAFEHQLAMLGFLQQNRRPATFCCTSDHNDFDFLLQHGPPSQSSCDSNPQSPTVKSKDYVNTSSRSNTVEGTGNKKENVSSWNGQGMNDGNNKERLKVRSLSDWLHLVRCGGGTNKDTGGTQSKDSTPPVSACVSTQSSPGPVRRAIKDPSPKPEAQKKEYSCMKEHQKLKKEILERRFSLPERQLEEAYQTDQKLVKPPLLPTSARDDERHEQQLKLLQQRKRQQLVNKTELTFEKRPPLPQQQSKPKQTENEVKTQERCSPEIEEQKQESIVFQEKQQVERRFDAYNYRISKKGDIAIINSNVTTRVSKEDQSFLGSKGIEAENLRQIYQQHRASQRPKSMPPPVESLVTGGEIFRQQMYLEYMNKVAERSERRRHKVIRLSSVPREDAPVSETQDTASSAATVHQLESEFMGRVRERMDKLGLNYDHEGDDGIQNKTESGADNCYIISGGGAAHGVGGGDSSVSQLPKHLQEFLVFAGGTDSDVNSDVDGELTPWCVCVCCVCLLTNLCDIVVIT